jgi:hypothetical protein
MANKSFFFQISEKVTTYNSKNEDRRRFGNKNKQTYFVLLSTCTIFAFLIF